MKFLTIIFVSLLNLDAGAATYEIKTALMGLDRKVTVKIDSIEGKEVPSEFSISDAIRTNYVFTIRGQIIGESYCPADQIVVKTKPKAEGEYPNQTMVIELEFVEATQSIENGLVLDDSACIEGTNGDFQLKLLTEVRSLGSREKVKKWTYVLPNNGATLSLQLDVASGKWVSKQN